MTISFLNVARAFSTWEDHSSVTRSMQKGFATVCKRRFSSSDDALKAIATLSDDFAKELSKKRLPQRNRVTASLSREIHKLSLKMPALLKEPPLKKFRTLQKMSVPLADKKRGFTFLSTDLKDDLKGSFEKAILSAQKTVVLIMYAISNRPLIAALNTAANKGVEVTAVYDSTETSSSPSFLGKKIHGYPRGEISPMHNKLLAIDHKYVWIGSANMSTQAMALQRNSVVSLTCETIAVRIEALATSLISKSAFLHPPLQVQFPDSKISMFFNPAHGQLSHDLILDKINKAMQRIFVAMYTFTHKTFAEALIRAHQRGVDVRVILDQENMKKTNQPIFSLLRQGGVSCCYRTQRGLLHHKIFLIDQILITGSCNATKAAFFSNDETLLAFDPIPPPFQKHVYKWWSFCGQSILQVR